MSRFPKRLEFGLNCPAGAKWYSCASGSNFVGCCANGNDVDPCVTGCAQASLRPASFDWTYNKQFPDASCESGSNFYTCKNGGDGRPFWGCCKSKTACGGKGCSKGDLTGALLNRAEQSSAYKPTGGHPTSTTTIMSSTKTSTPSTTITTTSDVLTTSDAARTTIQTTSTSTETYISTITATTTPTATAAPTSAKKLPIATIAGGAGGGVALILLGLLIYYILHAKRSRDQHRGSLEQRMLTGSKPDKPHDPSPKNPYFSPTAAHHELPAPLSPAASTFPLTRSSGRFSHDIESTPTNRSEPPPSPWLSPYSQRPQTPRSLLENQDQPHWTPHPWHAQDVYGGGQANYQYPQVHEAPAHDGYGQEYAMQQYPQERHGSVVQQYPQEVHGSFVQPYPQEGRGSVVQPYPQNVQRHEAHGGTETVDGSSQGWPLGQRGGSPNVKG